MITIRQFAILPLSLIFFVTAIFAMPTHTRASVPPVFSMPEGIGPDDYLPGHIIFKLKEEARSFAKSDGVDLESLNLVLDAIKAAHTRKMFPQHNPPAKIYHYSGQQYADLSLIFQTIIPEEESLEEAINLLYATGQVEYAQPRYLPQLLNTPNDPFIGSQYYLQNIQAFDAWAIEQGDTTMVIAIIDTGIDLFHPDLIHDIAYNWDDPINQEDSDNDGYIDNFHGWDLGENNNNPQYNVNAHGLHVAGIAGASTNNGTGMAGVGYNSRLLPIKISDADGRLVRAYEGIVYAADQGAQIINCSWGGSISPGQFGQDIINYAVLNKDAMVIAAAGNNNNQVRVFPASFINAMSVAATDINDVKFINSSFGNLVDIAAPGTNIFSTWVNGTYISSSGTSMASPVVAGAAALLRAHYPNYSALQIAAQLRVTTDNIDTIADNSPYAGLLGTGRLNIYRALTETHSPFILLTAFQHPNSHYQLYNPGESFPLAANFQNLLASAGNITAVLSTTSPHIEIESTEALLGTIAHMETTNNFEEPFLVRLKESIPSSHEANFTISFFNENQEFAGRQNFTLTFNLDYLDLHTNLLHTTINSKGNIGFNYPNFNQGLGFLYGNTNQNRTLIKAAGFLAGSSTSRVVDNVYGATENSFSDMLSSRNNARLQDNPAMGDIHISGSFTDSLAGSNSIGILVHYDIYAFEAAPLDKFLIMEYTVINTGASTLAGFHAGFFADWSIIDVRNHRAAYDQEHLTGYAFSANGGNFTAIQMLSHNQVKHYAFDNQGFAGSIRINDGFTSFEKYTALRTTRDNAGIFDKDNDISTLMSTGPFNIAAGDTVNLAFALLAGDHINDLQASAQLASLIYKGEYTGMETADDFALADFFVFPNPATNILQLQFRAGTYPRGLVKIYNMNARLVYENALPYNNGISEKTEIDISSWPQGSYILQIIEPNRVQSLKFLKK